MSIINIACSNQNSENNVSSNKGSSLTLADAPADVQAVYKARCISCHGTDLAGRMGENTNLQQVYNHLSYEQIVEQLTNGGEVMPPFAEKLTSEEIAKLAAWLANQS